MTLKERAQILYDFSACLSKTECEECAARGVICDMVNTRDARDRFLHETADILMDWSKYEQKE